MLFSERASSVARLQLPPWRGSIAYPLGLMFSEEWIKVTSGGSFLFYSPDDAAWGPLEVSFAPPPAAREPRNSITPAAAPVPGPQVPQGFVLQPGTFMALGGRRRELWFRAHGARLRAPSFTDPGSAGRLAAAINDGAVQVAYMSADALDAVSPSVWTGDDAIAVSNAGGTEPWTLAAPGLIVRVADTPGAPVTNLNVIGQRAFAATVNDNGLRLSFSHPRDLFPASMLARYPQWETDITYRYTFSSSLVVGDQRVAAVVAHDFSLNGPETVYAMGHTTAGLGVERVSATFALPYINAGYQPTGFSYAGWGGLYGTGGSGPGRGAGSSTHQVQSLLRCQKGAPYAGASAPYPLQSHLTGRAVAPGAGAYMTFNIPATPLAAFTARLRLRSGASALTQAIGLMQGANGLMGTVRGQGALAGNFAAPTTTTLLLGAVAPQGFVLSGTGLCGLELFSDVACSYDIELMARHPA